MKATIAIYIQCTPAGCPAVPAMWNLKRKLKKKTKKDGNVSEFTVLLAKGERKRVKEQELGSMKETSFTGIYYIKSFCGCWVVHIQNTKLSTVKSTL